MKECHVPARIVLATAGSFGDLFPTLGLGVELLRRGHQPVIATSPHYRPNVEGEGLAFHAVRPDLNPFDPAILARVMDPYKGSEVVIRELVVPSIRESYADFAEIVAGADLVVSHPITFAAPIAAEKLGVPWMSSVLAPLSFFSQYDFPAVPPMTWLTGLTRAAPAFARGMLALSKLATNPWVAPVHAFRRELGLAPGGHPLFEGQFSPLGTLAMFSAVIGAPQPDWPAHTTTTGFVFYDRHGEMPGDLARFLDAGDPPVVFTGGSTAVGATNADAFYAASVEAAKTLGRRAVLLVGPKEIGRVAPTLPPTMIAVSYAPHHLLFPRAAAVVHHGGAGTTGQALRAGRPALIVPHAHDQPDNALRAERAGVARVLDARRYTAARASEALRALLEEPRYAQAAAAAAARIRTEGGAAAAADVIEGGLRGK
jgi:UDP:flavonoid glycosyltransferase YjiC (YdhE family)